MRTGGWPRRSTGRPRSALVVDREPVWRHTWLVDVHQGAAVADRPARAVEPERVDASGAAVVEVHRAGVGTPADAVGDGQAGEHGGAAAVGFKAVQGQRPATRRRPSSQPRSALAGRRPRRSSARPRGRAPIARARGSSRCRQRKGIPFPRRARTRPQRPRDRADVPIERDCLNAFQGAIRGQRSPVHLAPQDVDPQQLPGALRASAGPRSAALGLPTTPSLRGYSCGEVHHDFDVFRLPVERLGSGRERHPACDQPAQPARVGGCERFGSLFPVAPAGVYGADQNLVTQHGSGRWRPGQGPGPGP